MKLHFFITLVVLLFVNSCECRKRNHEILSRKKRYLTFPEGSSVSIAACMTAQTGVIPPGIFTESIAWGLAYDLPNGTEIINDLYASKYILKRRHRRDLYTKMETIMNSMGYDGRSCILKTLCEAKHRFLPKEDNLLNYILKIVFGFPQERVLSTEPEEHHVYHWASQKGANSQECSELFTECPSSLIDIALGYYSQFSN